MTLDDNQVLVNVDEDRRHDVFVGFSPDDPTLVTMTTLVPNATMHIRATPVRAREIGVALIAFADQIEGIS